MVRLKFKQTLESMYQQLKNQQTLAGRTLSLWTHIKSMYDVIIIYCNPTSFYCVQETNGELVLNHSDKANKLSN